MMNLLNCLTILVIAYRGVNADEETELRLYNGKSCRLQKDLDTKFAVSVRTLKKKGLDPDKDEEYYEHLCTGTLVRGHWVLTAATCVESKGIKYHIVEGFRINTHKYKKAGVPVEKTVTHPDYVRDKDVANVALLKMKTGVFPGDNVKYVKLPKKKYGEDLAIEMQKLCPHVTVMSWGPTPDVKFPDELLCANFYLMDDDKCKASTGNNNFLCVINVLNIQVWRGDFGSPLMCNGVQYGMSRWGQNPIEKIASFTRVDLFLDFIYASMKEKRSDASAIYTSRFVFLNLIYLFILQRVLV